MYFLAENVRVNFDTEILAMSQYVENRWDCPVNLIALFNEVHRHVVRDTRLLFDYWLVRAELSNRHENRVTLLRQHTPSKEEQNTLDLYDNSCSLMNGMTGTLHALSELTHELEGSISRPDRGRAVFQELSSMFLRLEDARPKGWANIPPSADEHVLVDTWVKEQQTLEEAAFAGATFPTGRFVSQTSLPVILYRKNVRQTPPAGLVLAAYEHLRFLQVHQNTLNVMEDLKAFPFRDTEPNLIFDLVVGETPNPLVAAMLLLSERKLYSRQQYQQALDSARAIAVLPVVECIANLMLLQATLIREPVAAVQPSGREACRQFLKTMLQH